MTTTTTPCPSVLLPVHKLATEVESAAALSQHVWFDDRVPLRPSSNTTHKAAALYGLAACYSCGKHKFRRRHGLYTSMCARCGSVHYAKLMHGVRSPRLLAGVHALVIGGRTKIGYQTTLRLLRAGATVTCTTRFPERCVYLEEPDAAGWADRLLVRALELNAGAGVVDEAVRAIVDALPQLDVLFIVAAQTIRGIERREGGVAKNRYGDSRHFHGDTNSWQLTLGEVSPEEMEEVVRVNTVAPALIVQAALPQLLASRYPRKCIVNVHAREGMFSTHKSRCHPHTNVAKAGLHMLTHMLQTTFRSRLPCYGIDPGWVSVDEYGPGAAPVEGRQPLTELDGAAKLTDPLFAAVMPPVRRGTIRHYVYGADAAF